MLVEQQPLLAQPRAPLAWSGAGAEREQLRPHAALARQDPVAHQQRPRLAACVGADVEGAREVAPLGQLGRHHVGRNGGEMSFPAAARVALGDAQLRRNMGKATSAIRAKRAAAVAELDDWEALRDAGAAIKARAMATLPEQLLRLEASVTRAGGTCTGRATPARRTRSSRAS